VDEEQQQAEEAADDVARNQGALEGPAVDEDSGEDAEDGDGDEIGDLHAGDLLGVAWSLKVRTPMTAKRARKSPKFETIWAYQRRRMVVMRRTSRIDNGVGGVAAWERASPAASGCAVVLMGLEPVLTLLELRLSSV
jgi:hypothetical protein